MKILIPTALVALFYGWAIADPLPPVKMGLWEKDLTMNNGSGAPTTIKARSCVTPAEWIEMEANMAKQEPGCTVNKTKNAHGYTYTGTCKIGASSMEISGSSSIPDAEHVVEESHSISMKNGQKRQTDMHSISHWVSADCGKIKPGESESED